MKIPRHWPRRRLRPFIPDLGDHKVNPCRCGHLLHWQGTGKCIDCLCAEYLPDEHRHNLGFGVTAT